MAYTPHKQSEESKRKLRLAKLGKPNTPESKRKCSESMKGKKPWHTGTKGLKKQSIRSKQKISQSIKKSLLIKNQGKLPKYKLKELQKEEALLPTPIFWNGLDDEGENF